MNRNQIQNSKTPDRHNCTVVHKILEQTAQALAEMPHHARGLDRSVLILDDSIPRCSSFLVSPQANPVTKVSFS